METILPGMTAVLKTTGEIVYIMAIIVEVGEPRPQALVRRPLITRDGLRHLTEKFFVDELYTREESLQDQFDEMERRTKIIEDFRKAQNPVPGKATTTEFLQ